MKLANIFGVRRLGQRGALHLAAPLVVVLLVATVGVGMMVASHANPASSKKTAKTKSLAKGMLVIYGDPDVDYTGVQVQASNLDTKNHTCGGQWYSGIIIKKFPAAKAVGDSWQVKPVRLACSRTVGDEKYLVSYMKAHTVYGNAIAVDIDSRYCTSVFPDGQQVKAPYQKGKCGVINLKKITKANSTLRVLAAAGKDRKSIIGWVNLSAAAITIPKCTGQVTVTVSRPGSVATQNLPLKFVNPGKNKPNYCVAKLRFAGLRAGASYNVQAEYKGGPFFTSSVNSASVTIPQANSANNGTGGVPAPNNLN